jgi:hypothetical protein
MWNLKLLARVPACKQSEFLGSLRSVPSGPKTGPVHQRTFRDITDSDLVCWVGSWHTRATLEAFLRTNDFRALKGAVAVLGELVEMEMEKAQPWPESIEPSSR